MALKQAYSPSTRESQASVFKGVPPATRPRSAGARVTDGSAIPVSHHVPLARYAAASRGDAAFAASKRAFDLSFAILFILALAPALLVIAALIKGTSRGSVLFRQKRYGVDGELLEIWKFRTMYVTLGDLNGVKQTKQNDPRITPFGRFLRRTSLDELPQMFNVLKGDMSLIGPRPHVPGMLAGGVLYEELVPIYHERHSVRPGITGLAQVSGYRGTTDDPDLAKARVDHDLLYIQTWSFWLDLKILVLTVWRELTQGTGI